MFYLRYSLENRGTKINNKKKEIRNKYKKEIIIKKK